MNPDTYKHSTIGDGFSDPNLFEALKYLFNLLATKAKEFCAGVPTNLNKNLNGILTSFAPKSRLYAMSASERYRVCNRIITKNDEKMYHVDRNKNMEVSPGRNTAKL